MDSTELTNVRLESLEYLLQNMLGVMLAKMEREESDAFKRALVKSAAVDLTSLSGPRDLADIEAMGAKIAAHAEIIISRASAVEASARRSARPR